MLSRRNRPPLPSSAELGPLTEESLLAIRNLSTHVPSPDTEPCPAAVPAFRRAAVLLGLFGGRNGDLYVVLSQRSAQLRSHGGDTAIPGGRYEIGDADLEATARREAWEETGLPIDPKKAVRLCELQPFLSANELVVTPIVVLLIDPMIEVCEDMDPTAEKMFLLIDGMRSPTSPPSIHKKSIASSLFL